MLTRTSTIALLCLLLTTLLAGMAWPGPAALAAQPASTELANCHLFPLDNIWNTPIDSLPLDTRSNAYINSIGANTGLHADFGSGQYGNYGIPYISVPGNQPGVAVSFEYADESDPGLYPIPADAPIEGGADSDGDRHVLVLDRDACKLYELFAAYPQQNGSWEAGSGAIYDLRSNALRPAGWTSADAAGLPILPGLARCDEVEAGAINHALRFTASRTQRRYVWPARHFASSITDQNVPPMGQRFRLKASVDISGFSVQTQVLLKAMQTYGLILADNGSNWYISGAPGSCWDDDTLVRELRQIRGSDFEAVDVSSLIINPDSAQVRPSGRIPSIRLLSPAALPAASAGTTLTIDGTNFASGAQLLWNNQPRQTTRVNETRLSIALSSSDLASAANIPLAVINPGGQRSNSVSFSVLAPGQNPLPSLIRLTPNLLQHGTGPRTISISGLNFVNGATVQWRGTQRNPVFVSSTLLQLTLSPADLNETGEFELLVSNPGPGGGASNSLRLAVGWLAFLPDTTR